MTSALRGEEGVPSKADIVSILSKGGCVNLQTRGERGSKDPKFWRTSLLEAPLHHYLVIPGGCFGTQGLDEARKVRPFVENLHRLPQTGLSGSGGTVLGECGPCERHQRVKQRVRGHLAWQMDKLSCSSKNLF